MTVLEATKLPGIADLRSFKARGKFAMALLKEIEAGHTTDECERLLDQAVAFEQEALSETI